MAIDLQAEELLSLTDAAKALPPIDGKRPHVSTIWRWVRRSVRGIRLEHVRLGHRVCTSQEALARFAQRLADADERAVGRPVDRPQTKPARTAAERQRAVQSAENELTQLGI